jgi:predicted amidohydrolase YtcJ
MADDATVARIAALGLIPVPQGEFLTVYGDQYIEAIGVDRAQILYRQLAFLEAGLTVPGSSDCPVVGGSPLAGIQALVERIAPSGAVIGPDERLTVAQAVTAYTAGSAYAERSEADKGAIVPGKLADFVVLTDDLWQIPPDRIAGVQVQATVVGGSFGHGEENVAEA